MEIVAVVAALDGSRVVRGSARAARQDAAALGARVGAQLLADGARSILAEAERAQNPRTLEP
jgi:porphobilinogen deaminase